MRTREPRNQRKQSFIQGTLILLAAGIVNRLLGFVPRITLPRVIGAEGVGLYQLGYPFLIVMITIIAGGIPVAIAKLVAEAESEGDEKRVRRILTQSLWITTGISLVFTVFCFAAAKWLTVHLFTDHRVYQTFLAMSPMLMFIGISSVYRGYFQGRQNMIPTATSAVAETVVRIGAMLIFAWMMLPYGIEYAAAGAMFGVTVGELCGMLVLLHQYVMYRKKAGNQAATNKELKPQARSRFGELRRLFSIAIPVTAGKLVGSTSYFLESVLTVRSLAAAGLAAAAATAQYGSLQGMVIPLLLMPNALTYALAVSLVPSLSEAAARKDYATIHKRLHQSLRLALVTGAPFAMIMFVLARPLCDLLYNDAAAGRMLAYMAPIALFIYMQAPLQAALQALDRPGTALLNTFIGASIKLTFISLIASKPEFGIYGVVLAINVNIVLVTVLHYLSVRSLLRFSMRGSDFTKVGTGMLIAGVVAYGIMAQPILGAVFHRFIYACVGSVLVYLLLMVLMRMIDRHDLTRVPWIGKRL